MALALGSDLADLNTSYELSSIVG